MFKTPSMPAAGLLLLATLLAPTTQAADWKFVVDPDNSFSFRLVAGDEAVLRTGLTGWGPNWGWLSISSSTKAQGDTLSLSVPVEIGGAKPVIGLEVHATGPRTVVFDYTLKADQNVPITAIVATVGVPEARQAHVSLTPVRGKLASAELPASVFEAGQVRELTISSPAWKGPIQLDLDPGVVVGGDGDLRIKLAAETLKAGTTKTRITWSFPEDVALLVKPSDLAQFSPVVPGPDWFPYQPAWKPGPSAIGMEDWLEKPAGRRGGVRIKDDAFVLADGTPIKFWGTNLSYALSAPSKEDAAFTAARFARYGVNAVRMHKFTGADWAGIGSKDTALEMTPEGLDRLDYFTHQLASRGVYFGWSHTYHFTIRPQDRARIAGFDELMKKGGDTYGVINWAEDVQDLMIDMVVKLLGHRNPYSGKTYAQDPALCFVELHNEDDIFFWTSEGAFNDFPTYRKQLLDRYAQWLTAKYHDQAGLAKAWGNALKPDEQLASATISPQMNPWAASDAHLPQTSGGERARILDNAAFLHEIQNRFYDKFVKAIRKAGYEGPLIGSPWQAPGMLPHYLNLRSDALVGAIDRHNYFGGGFRDSMLPTPGGGYFSSGLQQVAGKPFGVSEWIHVYPSLYSAEGPVIMAAYGMGLQDWDSSYEFQSTSTRLDPAQQIVGNQPYGVWNADVPTQIGQFPLLARMVQRGDVQPGPVVAVRRVSPENLARGEFDFNDAIAQQHDVKTFSGTIPAETLAVGRALVDFVPTSQPSTFPDLSKFHHGTALASATNQLTWDPADRGLITINTAGTQGYVGFAHDRTLELADLAIIPKSPYASLLITAAEPKENLAHAKRLLVSALARNANTSFRMLSLDDKTIVDNGKPPILLEPVRAELRFSRRSIARVQILDHDGRPTTRLAPSTRNQFSIDTGRDRAFYYEVDLND